MRSGERLENDKHPRLPGLYHIVNSTFDTFITNSKDDFLLIAHASYQFDPTILFILADTLKDVKSFKIGVFDLSENDMEFKITASPTLLFFGKDKSNPTFIKKDKINVGLLDFINQNTQEKFDLSKMKSIFEERAKIFEALISSGKLMNETKRAQSIVKTLSTEENEKISKIIDSLDQIHKIDTSKVDIKVLSELIDSLKLESTNLFKLAKKAELMNVIPIHSNEEYEKETEKAKDKLIVIDWTASWCGPCKYVAPYFAALSDLHKDVVFLKIDVDECDELAKKAGISSMPTFHFHKKGNKIDEFGGADPNKLKEFIEKNK